MTTTVVYKNETIDLAVEFPPDTDVAYLAEVASHFNDLLAEAVDPHAAIRLSKVMARKAMETHAPAFDATTLVHEPNLGTMAVDQYFRVYYDDFAIMLWMATARAVSSKRPCETCRAHTHHDLAYTAGVFVHETEHPTRKHSKRFAMGSFESEKWGGAVDLEINDDLVEIFEWIAVRDRRVARMCLPPTGWFPHKTMDINGRPMKEGMTAEMYYALLPDRPPPPPPPKGQQGQPQQGSGQGQPQQGQGSPQQGSGQPTPSQPSQGSPGPAGQPGKMAAPGDHGSGVDGKQRPWDKGPPSATNPGVETADVDEIAQEIAENIKEAKGRGSLPGKGGKYISKVVKEARVNYIALLKRLVQNEVQRIMGDDHRTWTKLHTQSWVQDDVVIPGNTDYALNVGVLSDVSGSMDQHALDVTKIEVGGLLKAVGATVHAVTCDTQIKGRMKLDSVKDFQLQRGGGTDMVVGFEDLAKMRPKLDLIICYTDGDTPWPQRFQMKNIPVIVCLLGRYAVSEDQVPKWMKAIRIPEV